MKRVIPKKQAQGAGIPGQRDLPRLAAPARRALAAAGVQRLEDLTKFTENEVQSWHGIGPNALEQLRRALAEKDLAFAAETR